jgi:F0F1-type ATP synthase beta subunit
MSVINSGQVGVGLTPWAGVTPMADQQIEGAMKTMARSGTNARMLETGIKPIDLFAPLTEDGTMALLGIQGVGRIVLVEELIHRLSKANAPLRIVYLVEPNEPDSVRGMLTQEKEYPGDVVGPVETWWILSEKAVDPAATAAMQLFDAMVYCTPILGIQGLFPAIDPLDSRSRAAVSEEHAKTAAAVRDLIRRARGLMLDPVLLELLACRSKKRAWARAREFPAQRLAELSPDDRLLVTRARKLERFMTTPFFVAEPFTHRPGKFVPLNETIRGCREIMDGTFDQTAEQNFQFIGAIEDLADASHAGV